MKKKCSIMEKEEQPLALNKFLLKLPSAIGQLKNYFAQMFFLDKRLAQCARFPVKIHLITQNS